MATAQALVNFRKSYPIDFSLLDQDQQAVMYISEDKDDWELHLTIANTSSQPITMIDGQGETSATNHHFALRFRPGTLAKRAIDLLTSDQAKNILKTTDWQIAKLLPPPPNAPVTLYLRYAGANKVLKQNQSLSISLSGISAAPGSGSRGTQVELIPHQLKFEGESGAGIANSRTQYLHVTNHSGRKNIPLHVGFVGGNHLLNGATDQDLKLRVTNVFKSKDAKQSTITFRGANSATHEPRTELVLSYDKGNEDWELGTDLKVTAVSKKPLHVNVQEVSQGDRPEVLIAFEQDFQLNYGESFDIEISRIHVSSKTGQANVYLHYNNIPGYWDGQFVCAVEKWPIVVQGDNVGIGTPARKAKVQVAGETKTTTLKVEEAATFGESVVIGDSPKPSKLEVIGDLRVTGRITAGEGEWKDVTKFGTREGAKVFPFTTVESMRDEKGVVHLRGLLFVGESIKKDDFICLLDPAHQPKSDHNLNQVPGLTSSSDPVWGTLKVRGRTGNDVAQIGWIKWEHFEFPSVKMVSLDGVKFQSDI